MRNTKLIYKVKDSKLFFKLETGTSLKIVIVKHVIIRMYLYNSIVNTTIKANWYIRFYWKEYFIVYRIV